MSKNKTFRFTTEITPETEVILNGRYGQPLNMRLSGGSSAMTVKLDTESIIRLQAFLSDYLQKEEVNPAIPAYEPTGRALAIMDGETLDILRIFKTESVIGFAGAETDSYNTLCDKVRCIMDIELPRNVVFIFFDTFDGCISRSVIRRILRACISYQADFVRTGDLSRSRRMILDDIEAFTTIDSSIISRATQDIVILSPAGIFTLKATDASLERPSLFDEGSKTTDGHDCSRKSVLSALRILINGENKAIPYTDDDLSDLLAEKGFAVARRTVSKYRGLLGIPKRSERRAVSNVYFADQR